MNADFTDEGELSAVERSYSNLMALTNEDISKPGFGDFVENASPALNSFGHMFSTAKENFYSHVQADQDESSLIFSPKSSAGEENFYSDEIGQEESSPISSPKTLLGNLFDGT